MGARCSRCRIAEPSALVGPSAICTEYIPETRRPAHLYARQQPPMVQTTLASVLVDSNTFEVRELPIPPIGADAALLRVEACGVCGSDARIRRRVADGPK